MTAPVMPPITVDLTNPKSPGKMDARWYRYFFQRSLFDQQPSIGPARTVIELPLPTSVDPGTRGFVTDANATTFQSIVAGGGSNGVPVFSDGTNWRIG
jgi:hypothetical protein